MATFSRLTRVLGKLARPPIETDVRPVNLRFVCDTVDRGCMGLPQDLVDYIVDMLQDDRPTLEACSLTCKALFVSTRHLIHRTLQLTARNNESILTRGEKYRLQKEDDRVLELQFLSYAGDRGVLQHVRRLHIHIPGGFTPNTLLPHLHHFKSLEQVHTLTIGHYDAHPWTPMDWYQSFFTHFQHSLTTLTLHNPSGHYRHLLQFALQFPNIENLCLESLDDKGYTGPSLDIPDQLPPLCGHFRLEVSTISWPMCVRSLASDLSNRINFRSVELEGFLQCYTQPILDGCAHTLEFLTIISPGQGTSVLPPLRLAKLTSLRRLTFRISFDYSLAFELRVLLGMISTIRSRAFHELALEVVALRLRYDWRTLEDLDCWQEIDKFLEGTFSKRKDFRFTIRTAKFYDQETFRRHVEKTLPLLARTGCVHYENTST